AYDFVEQVFTVEGWFNTSTTGVAQRIIGKGTSARYYVSVQSDNTLNAVFTNSTGTTVYARQTVSAVTDGQWHHFVAVFDTRAASENLTLYLDGVEQTSVIADNRGTANYTGTANSPLTIGARSGGALAFNGRIDEIAIYGRALSEAEIAGQFQSGGQNKYGNVIQGNLIGRNANNTGDLPNGNGIRIVGGSGNVIGGTAIGEGNIIVGNTGDGINVTSGQPLPGMIGYWKADSSTNDEIQGLNVTLMNGATYASGKDGQAFSFDGVDDYVLVGTQSETRITDNTFAVDAWIYKTGSTGNDQMIVNREGEYEFAVYADGTLRYALAGASPGWVWQNTGYTVQTSQWTHVALSYDGAQVVVYVNGTAIDTRAATGNIGDIDGAMNELRIGSRQSGGGTSYFQGQIDDVGLYGYALTAQQVAEIYAMGGVSKMAANGNTIRGNSISDNGSLGIDLANNGITTNDAGDVDYGQNDLLNFPVITTATTSGSVVTISGTLNSIAAATYQIDFYRSNSGNQGAVYLGSRTVTTDGTGNVAFTDSFAASAAVGDVVTATVTDLRGSTSEFSTASALVSSASILIVDTSSDVADGDTTSISSLLTDRGSDGSLSLREAIIATNNTTATDEHSYLEFDGAADKLHLPGINLGTEWTMSVTVKPTADDVGSYDRLISYGIPGVSEIFEVAYAADGSLAVNSAGVGWKVSTDFDFVFGRKYEVTATLGGGVAKVYVDGREVMRVATPANLTGGTLALMDRIQDTGHTESGIGRVYRFRTWSTALDPRQLPTVDADVIDYRFAAADISGATLTDHSGAGHHATLVGDPTSGQETSTADIINFDILNTGPHRIEVSAALPDITDSLLIDGWSEPDYVAATNLPVIELDGRNTASGDGLRLTAGTSTIRGLSITNFQESGIEVAGGTEHQISGNHLGVNTLGTLGFEREEVAGWWTGDNTTEDFAGSNDGTLMNGATYALGKVGTAFSFDGVDDSVTVADSSSLDLSDVVTMDAWINTTGFAHGSGFQAVVVKGTIGVGSRNYAMFIDDSGGLLLQYDNTSDVQVNLSTASGLITAGVNYHVAGVIDTVSGTMRIYVDGRQVASGATNGAMKVNSSPLTLGTADTTHQFAGTIDAAAVFNRALSADEIHAIYSAGEDGIRLGNTDGITVSGGATNTIIGTNADGTDDAREANTIGGNSIGISIDATAGTGNQVQGNRIGITNNLPSGAISYYTFDDGTAKDVLGNNQPSAANAPAWVSGASGLAGDFNGVDDYIVVPNSTSLSASTVTVDVWVRPDATGVNSTIVTKEGVVASSEIGFGFRQRADNHFWFVLGREGAASAIAASTTTLTAGQWYHLTGTYDGSNAKLYVNGILEATTATTVALNSTTPMVIGRQQISGGFFDGMIDELALFDRPLTSGEVAAVYAAGDMKGRSISNQTGISVLADQTDIGGYTATERNVISGNDGAGVLIQGTFGAGNGVDVQGNFIGTDLYGGSIVANGGNGVYVSGSDHNTIGGTNADTVFGSNLFYWDPANGGNGHWYALSTSDISWNDARAYAESLGGTLATVTSAEEQAFIETTVLPASPANSLIHIGMNDIVSEGTMVWLTGETTAYDNFLSGEPNYAIGENAVAMTTYAGLPFGKWIDFPATGNVNPEYALIEFTVLPGGNLISGNANRGVYIATASATDNIVAGNFIGTDVSGTVDLGNYDGVYVSVGERNTIGGSDATDRNLISGNEHVGVIIADVVATSYTDGTVIQGNFIGTDISGSIDLGNTSRGIDLSRDFYTQVGGTGPHAGNLISGNGSHGGIWINGAGDQFNRLEGNVIGLDATGTVAIGNNLNGVYVTSSSNLIGGTSVGSGNVISGNVTGIVLNTLNGTRPDNNIIQGNLLGTDITGTVAIGNSNYGIALDGGSANLIGGTTAAARNVISGNAWSGVLLNSNDTFNNTISGNYIGTDISGTLDLGNLINGIAIYDSGANTIGGDAAGEGNLISGNLSSGVYVQGNGAASGQVGWWRGNNNPNDALGLNNATLQNGVTYTTGVTGTANSAFSLDGVDDYITVADSASLDTTAAVTLDAWVKLDTLPASFASVVQKTGGSLRNYYLGINNAGGLHLSYYNASAANVNINDLTSPITLNQWNHIAGVIDTVAGVMRVYLNGQEVASQATNGSLVANNELVQLGSTTFDGALDEVGIYNRALTAAEIADIYNAAGTGKAGNTLQGNLIGTDVTGTAAIGNATGVYLSSAWGVTIGGDTAAARNVISGNTTNGIVVNASHWVTIQGNYIGVDITGSVALANSSDYVPGNGVAG
ncbi:MAG: hypothetical protein KDA96_10410, partial [Planctomycetaceae bacterium]|nr:hypothetical protein [Planctomycetaceae bacterium]